jgi:hypothetical protein
VKRRVSCRQDKAQIGAVAPKKKKSKLVQERSIISSQQGKMIMEARSEYGWLVD